MTLKELKAKLDASAAKLAESPDDEALKAAHEEAKSAYEAAQAAAQNEDSDDEDDGDEGKLDVSKLDPKAQKLISDLRKENAERRKALKSTSDQHSKLKKALIDAGVIENDEEAPEEKLKTVTAQNELNVFNSAILEAAVEHNVGKESLKYFKFLVNERVAELGDDEELSAEDLAELAGQARKTSAPKKKSTSVEGANGDEEGDGTPPPGGDGAVTLDQFMRMNMGEKSAFFLKNRKLYDQYMAEAKAKKLFV
jgi:hypothetical protein